MKLLLSELGPALVANPELLNLPNLLDPHHSCYLPHSQLEVAQSVRSWILMTRNFLKT